MKNNYIHAVLEMITSGTDTKVVLKGLSETLTKKGHTSLHGAVLRGVVRILSSKSSSSGTVVTVASEKELHAQKSTITAELENLGANEKHQVIIDPTLIGGSIIEHNNIVIDSSYKTCLVKLYRSLTT